MESFITSSSQRVHSHTWRLAAAGFSFWRPAFRSAKLKSCTRWMSPEPTRLKLSRDEAAVPHGPGYSLGFSATSHTCTSQVPSLPTASFLLTGGVASQVDSRELSLSAHTFGS